MVDAIYGPEVLSAGLKAQVEIAWAACRSPKASAESLPEHV
jgi:hypothetical protein